MVDAQRIQVHQRQVACDRAGGVHLSGADWNGLLDMKQWLKLIGWWEFPALVAVYVGVFLFFDIVLGWGSA